MKRILAAVVCLLSVQAFATSNVILSKVYPKNDKWELDRYQYRVNTQLGRAWFKVELADMSPFEDLDWEDHRVMPQGMVYDSANNEIRINDTVCATTRSTRRSLRIYPTGRCTLSDRESIVRIDDGFNIITKKKLEVILTIN
ncbi:MAG: hypothetical protein CME65_02565 [Halobacteriovoraceae bacterium]|nr:hypothetical protein [Halobacteriovoraceae bacterium]|tara:strand:+ start:179 stop:604 length:426 start_codon:yes stop_codon:yes gene_type:complete